MGIFHGRRPISWKMSRELGWSLPVIDVHVKRVIMLFRQAQRSNYSEFDNNVSWHLGCSDENWENTVLICTYIQKKN